MTTQQADFTRVLLAQDRKARRVAKIGYSLVAIHRYRCGVAAAKALLQPQKSGRIQDGLVELWIAGRTNLSLEALVIQTRWRGLFTEGEVAEALRRLAICEH